VIRVYYLKTQRVNNTDIVNGNEYIHGAILDDEGTLRKLIQDTTDNEHAGLIKVAEKWRDATEDEVQQLEAMKAHFPYEPPRNLAQEINELKAKISALEVKAEVEKI